MIIRLSFMVVASVAALKISHSKTSSYTKRNSTIKSPGGDDDSDFELEFEERENSTANANHVIQNEEEKQIKTEMLQNLLTGEIEDSKLLRGGKKMDNVTEMELLKSLVQNYTQREVKLERRLIELNSLKEEQSAIAQMQKQLEKKTSKLDSLQKTIASMQSENKIIHEKIRADAFCKKQLAIAKKIINEMTRKKDVYGSPVKDQILMLKHQVTELQKYNNSGRIAMMNKKFEDVQDSVLKVLELKRKNKELKLEKREIGIKLATTQKKIRSEEETMTQKQEEITGLRQVHEELLEQVERLQRNKFDMVQELVYQRWLYTCLRFEVQGQQKQIRKASRGDSSQNSSRELYEKIHALTSDPELESISSNATLDKSDEIETTITLESSSTSQSSNSKNSSLLNKMKRWRKTKDCSNNISPKGMSSMSMIASSDLSKPRNCGGDSPVIELYQKTKIQGSSKSLEKPIIPRLKRVSFRDSGKPYIYHDMQEEFEDVIDNKETYYGQIMELNSTIVSWDKLKPDQYDKPNNSKENAVGSPFNNDSTAKNECTKNQSGHSDEMNSSNELVCRNDYRIKTQLVQLVAFFFFSLILLAYFRIK